MNSRRKLLAVLLLVVMAVSLLSVCAFAADGEDAAKSITCTTCSGTGVSQGAECDVCEGTGVITSTSRMAFSFWALVPPIVAIILALITKEVYSSLFVGILLGALFYSNFDPITGLDAIINDGMVPAVADNAGIMLFLVILGAMVALINRAGGSAAFGRWAETHIKTRVGAMFATFLLGVLIFVDDYFNCLTVGAVMRPVTDRFHVSHEKLAWIIDSTAAPVCIIAPVSSWAVAVGGYLGDDGFTTFVQSIPYNFYALLTIFFVFFMLITNKNDYGPMRAAEAEAKTSEDAAAEGGKLLEKLSTMGLSDQAEADPDDHTNLESVVTEQADIEQSASAAIDEYKGLDISEKGKVYDLIVPILVLIFFSILGMMYTGGFFEGVDFATAVGENPVGGLCIGATVALCVAGAMFLPRGLTTLSDFVESISEGVRSMVGAIMILVLAWSLGGCCRYMLGTGDFVSSFLNSLGVSLAILPCIIFLVAGFIGFAMGTSWGTIALILPIVVGVFNEGDPLFLVAVGATLAGAVYGDHISPISDTTILSSAGAKCNHLRHVATQLPYATTVMLVCFVCYIVAGFTGNPWISLVLGAVLIVVAVKILHKSNIGMKK